MIKIIEYTKDPLTLMGQIAGICTNNMDISKYKDIAIQCLIANHGRVLEYADVIVEISEYSARTMRELYTHIIGTSRLQRSTRYVNESNFNFYIPDSISADSLTKRLYFNLMKRIKKDYNTLLKLGIPKEDAANILPLGMHSKMVLKINARALIHLAEERLCSKAYKEMRDLVKDLISAIESLGDEEWKFIISSSCKSKCEKLGYCPETKSCYKITKNLANEVSK